MSAAPMEAPGQFVVGEIWHRADGTPRGEDLSSGVEIWWTRYRVERLTPKGAWLVDVRAHAPKPRWAAEGCVRWCSRTEGDALRQLVGRKTRQLRVLAAETEFAMMTMDAARSALQQEGGAA